MRTCVAQNEIKKENNHDVHVHNNEQTVSNPHSYAQSVRHLFKI